MMIKFKCPRLYSFHCGLSVQANETHPKHTNETSSRLSLIGKFLVSFVYPHRDGGLFFPHTNEKPFRNTLGYNRKTLQSFHNEKLVLVGRAKF